MRDMNRKETPKDATLHNGGRSRFTAFFGSEQRNYFKSEQHNFFDPGEQKRRGYFHNEKYPLVLVLFVFFLAGGLGFWLTSQATAEESMTYVALGDSLTAGVGASEEDYLRLDAFVPQLTAHLREEQEVYVENHGIPGLRTEQLLTYVQNDITLRQTLAEANVVTMTIGGNDLLQLLSLGEVDEASVEKTIEQFAVLFTETMEEIRTLNADVPVFVMDLYNPYEESHPRYDVGERLIPAYNEALLSEIEQMNNVHPVHVYDLFHGQGSALTHIEQEDIHPNDEGYMRIYEAFREEIKTRL